MSDLKMDAKTPESLVKSAAKNPASIDVTDDDPIDEGMAFFMKFGYPKTEVELKFSAEVLPYARGIRKTKSVKSIIFRVIEIMPLVILLILTNWPS